MLGSGRSPTTARALPHPATTAVRLGPVAAVATAATAATAAPEARATAEAGAAAGTGAEVAATAAAAAGAAAGVDPAATTATTAAAAMTARASERSGWWRRRGTQKQTDEGCCGSSLNQTRHQGQLCLQHGA